KKTNLCLPALFRHSKPGSPASGRFGGLKRTMERPGGNSRARFSLYAKDQIMKKSKLCQGEIRNSFRKRGKFALVRCFLAKDVAYTSGHAKRDAAPSAVIFDAA